MNKRMITGRARVSGKGWVVVPKEIRDAIDLAPGDEVRFVLWLGEGERPRLELRAVPPDPVAATAGMLARPDKRLWTEEMVEEHRREVEETERETTARKRSRRRSA